MLACAFSAGMLALAIWVRPMIDSALGRGVVGVACGLLGVLGVIAPVADLDLQPRHPSEWPLQGNGATRIVAVAAGGWPEGMDAQGDRPPRLFVSGSGFVEDRFVVAAAQLGRGRGRPAIVQLYANALIWLTRQDELF